jgi:hypothetical protein
LKPIVLNAPLFSTLLLAACLPAAPSIPTAEPTAAAVSTLPAPPTTEAPTAAALSYVPATCVDDVNSFEIDYPADWSLDPNAEVGPRGSYAQLFSPGTTAGSLADGGSRFGIMVYDWDPKKDLVAYVDHRRLAWEHNGFTFIRESQGELIDGRPEMDFTILGRSTEVFVLYTTVGDRYLEIVGEGDLVLVEKVARTLRPIGGTQ